jgi:PAS domain S-box-containing protein
MAQSDSGPLTQFRRFRVLLDAIPQPAIVKDTEGRIALANQAASRLWNKKPEELVGLTSSDLVDPASACWAEAVDTLALYSSAPKLLRRRMKIRGQQQSCLVSVAPVYLTRGERPDGIIAVVHLGDKDVFDPAESAEAIRQRQFAEVALIKCELRDEEGKKPDEARTPGGLWLPLKQLLQI